MDVLEVDDGIFGSCHEKKRILLVLQEEILGVGTGYLTAKGLRLLDRKKWGVFDGLDVEMPKFVSIAIRSSRVAGMERVSRPLGDQAPR